MPIRRRCKYRKCKGKRGCLAHLQFDVKHRGRRFRMAVNDFAIPRMELGKQRPIQSMEELRDWARLFIGEIKAGRDPRRPRTRSIQAGSEIGDVSAFLDAYLERCVTDAGLPIIGRESSPSVEESVAARQIVPAAFMRTYTGSLTLEFRSSE
jgi:hypothetical protein